MKPSTEGLRKSLPILIYVTSRSCSKMKSDLGSLAEMCSEGDGHMIMTKPDIFTRHLKTYVKCVCDCLVVDTLALTAASSSSQQYLQTVEAIFSQIYSQGVLLSADSQLHQLLLYPCDILPQYLEALTELESFVRSSDCDRAQASASSAMQIGGGSGGQSATWTETGARLLARCVPHLPPDTVW